MMLAPRLCSSPLLLQAAEKQKSLEVEKHRRARWAPSSGRWRRGLIGANVRRGGRGADRGERFHRKDVKKAALTADLKASEAERTKLIASLQEAMSHGEQLSAALERKTVG